MKVLRGRLIFSGHWLKRPWALVQPDGSTVDLYPAVHEFLTAASGRRLEHEELLSSYEVRFDPRSELELEYKPDQMVFLRSAHAGSNIGAYIPSILTRFSGRLIEAVVDERGLRISVDPAEVVHGVRLMGDNTGSVSEAEAESICGFGKGPDTCLFLVTDGGSFQCWKFTSVFARDMLSRLREEKTSSKKVGSCTIDPAK